MQRKVQLKTGFPVIHLPNANERKCFIDGLKLMQQSLDPMHDVKHVGRMLSMLVTLEKKRQLPKLTIHKRSALILAIIWHDVWKAGHLRTSYLLFLYDQIVEGIASARMFVNYSRKHKLAPNIIQEVSYAIRKHSTFQIYKRKTEVSQILYDLDTIERFSSQRLQYARDQLLERGEVFVLRKSWYLVAIEYIYMYWFSLKPNLFYSKWAGHNFEQVRKKYFSYLQAEVSPYLYKPWIYTYFFTKGK